MLSEIRICFSKTFDVIDCPWPAQSIEIKVKYPAACTKNLKSSKEGEYPTTNTHNFKESPSSCGHCIKPKPPDNTTAVEVEVTSLSVFLLIAFGFVLYVFVQKCKTLIVWTNLWHNEKWWKSAAPTLSFVLILHFTLRLCCKC